MGIVQADEPHQPAIRERLKKFRAEEGVVFIGKAQEKGTIFRAEKRRNPKTGQTYPWIVKTTAMVNQYYVYAVDRDFGPFFLKFCSYFPYNGKLCINGHEYAKRQLAQRKIDFVALDNGLLSCGDPKQLQTICDELAAEKIDALLRKWLRRLPHPFLTADRKAGYRYDISILQAEFSLTQVLDRPVHGRMFFEEVIRENLDLGRPDEVQLIFNRKITSRTPGRFRARIVTEGVTPSLNIHYKNTRIKQYHKEGRALRTETTINNTKDFYIGKRLHNLAKLREIGFPANRRVLAVEQISHDCIGAEETFRELNCPVEVNGQRASALRFADPKVQALWHGLVLFQIQANDFRHADLRRYWAKLNGRPESEVGQGAITYQLRRLRLHGLIERLPKTHRYRVTPKGLRVALFCTRTYVRILRPGLASGLAGQRMIDTHLKPAFDIFEREVQVLVSNSKLAS